MRGGSTILYDEVDPFSIAAAVCGSAYGIDWTCVVVYICAKKSWEGNRTSNILRTLLTEQAGPSFLP